MRHFFGKQRGPTLSIRYSIVDTVRWKASHCQFLIDNRRTALIAGKGPKGFGLPPRRTLIFSDRLRLRSGAACWLLIGQVVAAPAREQCASGVQHSDAASAVSTVDAGATGKPRPSAAKMTTGPSYRHPLFGASPLWGYQAAGSIDQTMASSSTRTLMVPDRSPRHVQDHEKADPVRVVGFGRHRLRQIGLLDHRLLFDQRRRRRRRLSRLPVRAE
jgi:hypothetical protein